MVLLLQKDMMLPRGELQKSAEKKVQILLCKVLYTTALVCTFPKYLKTKVKYTPEG